MTKKIFSLLTAIALMISVFSIGFNSYAADTDTPVDEEIIEEYTTIASNTYLISISGVTATCNATLKPSYQTSLYIKMELQKKSSNGTYSTVKTWTASKTGISLSAHGTKTINPLSTYRLKVTFTADRETVVRYAYP